MGVYSGTSRAYLADAIWRKIRPKQPSALLWTRTPKVRLGTKPNMRVVLASLCALVVGDEEAAFGFDPQREESAAEAVRR